MLSTTPPAAKGTTMRIGFAGYPCAEALVATSAITAATKAFMKIDLLTRAALALLAALASSIALAQALPAKPLHIIVPFPPGGAVDPLVRALASGLAERIGQPVIVDNRPGSGGNIGAALVARAPADGYTLMVGTDATMASNVHLYKYVGFDPVKDFAPVAYAGANIICLAVNAELPITSVADVIAYAKKNPGKLNYGSSGTGSPHHLAGELLHQKTGIDIAHIPYKGGGAAVNDLLGGHIGMAFLSLRPRCRT